MPLGGLVLYFLGLFLKSFAKEARNKKRSGLKGSGVMVELYKRNKQTILNSFNSTFLL